MPTSTNPGNLITPSQPKTASQSAYEGLGSLVHLLPTGTVFLFQFLNPLLSNNGKCLPVNKAMSGALIAFCSFTCFFSSFTDSYIDSRGVKRYGITSITGMWPGADGEDLSAYKLRIGDFVHAFLCLCVFAVLALLDSNSVNCFYPSFMSTQKTLIIALPAVIGSIASTVFVLFPNQRHGIGYPSSTPDQQSGSSWA